MRKFLDRLYIVSGVLAATFVALICLLVTAQVVLNIITKVGGSAFSMTISSYSDFAGYFLAAASFLALAYTFTNGGHIRVTLVLRFFGEGKLRFFTELLSLALCTAAAFFATYYMAHLLIESYTFGDKSSGIISIPIWIPQVSVVVGLAIFSIALLDLFVQTFLKGEPIIDYNEQV